MSSFSVYSYDLNTDRHLADTSHQQSPVVRERTSGGALAAAITREASKQTYYTIRLLVDRPAIPDAYRAYAYFRWLDDCLDEGHMSRAERMDFVKDQWSLLEHCYYGSPPAGLGAEERLLVELVRRDQDPASGLYSYLHNMMKVMAFDADRRGRLISQNELADYTYWLAKAVTDALFYFIDGRRTTPYHPARYLAASGAHVAHMLRDALDDAGAGYFNIPCEVLVSDGIAPFDICSEPYRAWVATRVRLAREYFAAGKDFLAQAENPRCRLAGYAYMARFEGVLDAIEAEAFQLRAAYPEYKTLKAGLGMAWNGISFALNYSPAGRALSESISTS
jgi:hypothetical protein